MEAEGLRERKKRLMRQHLSDTATGLFLDRGFDEVKVADVAAACGVSEKTVYNYFPTKEALLLDREEAMSRQIRSALGPDRIGEPPVDSALRVLEADLREVTDNFDDPQDLMMIRRFGDLIDGSASLRAAQRDQMDRMVQVAAEALAERAGVSPEEPEPQIAADAILGLWRIQFRAMHRHADGVTSPDQLLDRVNEEVRRAARLIGTGLWANDLTMTFSGKTEELRLAAETTAHAKRQVHAALRQAKAAWREALREQAQAARAARKPR